MTLAEANLVLETLASNVQGNPQFRAALLVYMREREALAELLARVTRQRDDLVREVSDLRARILNR